MPDSGGRPDRKPDHHTPGHHKPDHHAGRRFRNPPGSPVREPGIGRAIAGFMWRQWRRRDEPLVIPDGHVVAPAEARAAAHAAGADALTWLGHAAFLLRLGGRTVLTDPYLADWASPVAGVGPRRFVPPGLAVHELPRVDVVAISHNHYDHLDVPTLRALPDKHRVKVVVPLRLGPLLRRLGFAHVTELDWHETVHLDGLAITATPAVHGSARGLLDRDRTLWTSYALAHGRRKVWFGGDTAHGAVFRELGRRHGPFDLALVGIGAYEPRSIMAPVHANPEEAVRIACDIGARRIAGMHWGSVRLTEEPPFEPPERFRAAARAAGYADDEAWIMAIGETRSLAFS
jgi:L-ascorbate metabolism protein UlaG (beta-lactamase superfamily)